MFNFKATALAGPNTAISPINALSLIRPVSIRFGSFNKSYSNGEMYCQQMLENIGISQLLPYKKGLYIGGCENMDSAIYTAPINAVDEM